jgi:Family of unknown function (DUF5715)
MISPSFYQTPDPAELARARSEIQIELDWVTDSGLPHFQNSQEIENLLNSAENYLVRINASTINFQDTLPIMRYRNPDNRADLHSAYPPYLHTKAHQMLLQIANLWRDRMDELRISKDYALALTTLLKTIEHKKEIISAGAYAFLDGPHSTGLAFDISACDLYLKGEPLRPPRPNIQNAQDSLGGRLVQDHDYAKLYNPQSHSELKNILLTLQAQNQIHFIHENAHQPHNTVFHICVRP